MRRGATCSLRSRLRAVGEGVVIDSGGVKEHVPRTYTLLDAQGSGGEAWSSGKASQQEELKHFPPANAEEGQYNILKVPEHALLLCALHRCDTCAIALVRAGLCLSTARSPALPALSLRCPASSIPSTPRSSVR